jgi:hypothetical protein
MFEINKASLKKEGYYKKMVDASMWFINRA